MSLASFLPHGRIGRWILMASATLTLLVVLAGCGGGEDAIASQAAMEQPKIEVLGFTELGYAKLRLSFHQDGFSQSVVVGDEIVWHSGMIHADQPSASRAKVLQAPDGSLYADVVLYYTTDRGIFGVTAGRTIALSGGQPTNYMLVANWSLPASMKPVTITGGRTWIDIQF